MSTANTTQVESVLKRQVLDIVELTRAGQFSKSIGTVKSAKSIYPKNIFLIALEKQLEKLLAMTYTPALTDPERQKELLESIPNLVHRAVEAMEKEEPIPTSRPPEHGEEREAAFARLKDEYFQLADSYVKNGDYQNALQEIKRVLILDPENSTAKEYQKKINEFVDLKAKASPEQQGTAPQEKKNRPEPEPSHHVKEKGPIDTRPPQREKEPERTLSKPPAEPIVPKRTKVSSTKAILIAVPVFVACLAAVYFFFRPTDSNSKTATSTPANTSTIASNDVPKEPPKTEQQPQKQESQDVVVPASAENLQPATSENQNAGTQNKSETSSEAPAPSAETTPQVTEKTKTNTESKSIEPPPSTSEKSQGNKTRGSTTNSYERTPSRGLETPEVKQPPQLAKLDITPALPASNNAKASPAPIKYTERKPQVIRLVTPKYPEAARLTGAQGEVLVSVQIDPQGKPIRAKIVRTSNELFNAAVIDAVMHSQYSPGVMPSGPVTTWLTVPFTFKQTAGD